MNKKVVFIGLGVVVAGALVYINLASNHKRTTKVHAAEVETHNLIEVVSASGRIQPTTKVDITSEVNGEIIALPVKEGQYVDQGQPLVLLDTVQLRSDMDQAKFAVDELKARLEGASSRLEKTREEFERQQSLFKQDLTSETQFTNAKYDYLDAKASYDATKALAAQAQARYEKQLDNFRKARIVAPMPGIITFLDAEVGEIAAAQTAFTQGKRLMTVSDLKRFEVEVDVDETEINKVHLGQPSKIEVDAFPDTSFAGRVVEIGNTAITQGLGSQDQSTNFRVKVVFEDSDVQIRPGMSATVDITTASVDDALAIPFACVVMRSFDTDSLERARAAEKSADESGAGSVQAAETTDTDTAEDSTRSDRESKRKELKGVFVIQDGKARFVEIETGIADQKNIQVVEGLSAGDSVISGPYKVLRRVEDGDDVEVIKKDNERKK